MKLTVEEIKSVLEKAEKQIEELQALLSTVEVEPYVSKKGQIYWYIDSISKICSKIESVSLPDEHRYEIGNYYLTKEDAIRAEKQIRLFRLLDRFSRQNGWTDEAWEDDKTDKCCIYCGAESIEIGFACEYREIAQVYFISESVAQQAIEKYHDLIMEVMAI